MPRQTEKFNEMSEMESGIERVPSRAGRHYFGSLNMVAPQEDVFSSEEIASDERTCTDSSANQLERSVFSELISEEVELLDPPQPAVAQDLLDVVQDSRPNSPLPHSLSRKLQNADGESDSLLWTEETSELLSEGVDLLERLQPAMAEELIDLVMENQSNSPIARSLIKDIFLGHGGAAPGLVEASDSIRSNSGQDYTILDDDDPSSTSSIGPLPQELIKTEFKFASDKEQVRAAKSQQMDLSADCAGETPTMRENTCGINFEQDCRALFRSCIDCGGNGINPDVAFVDPVRLRSALMDYGFTGKQTNLILTRLHCGEEGGGNRVSFEQLRAAVVPVLQECDGMIEQHSTTGAAVQADQQSRTETEINVVCPKDSTETHSSLDDSNVSMIGEADATGAYTTTSPGRNFGFGIAPSPGKEDSTVAGRAERSTQMDSICMSDIAENSVKSDSTISASQDSRDDDTPQKLANQCSPQDIPFGPAIQNRNTTTTRDHVSSGPTAAEHPDNLEDMARSIAMVCKKGVWNAWRGESEGLDPIYAISLWEQTQALMMKCGFVDVLALLLAGVTSELVAQGQKRLSAETKTRVRLDGTVIHQSRFSKSHIKLAHKVTSILINLALHSGGSACCRSAEGLRTNVEKLFALPIREIANDAGCLLFLLDDCLRHRLGYAFSPLLLSGNEIASPPAKSQRTGIGLVYVSYAKCDEQLVLDISAGLRREGIQIVTRDSLHSHHARASTANDDGNLILKDRNSQQDRSGNAFRSKIGPSTETGALAIPVHGPVENMKKYGPIVTGMCFSILKADVALVIASLEYFESFRCRLEAAYLSSPQCHTIPVLVDRLPQDDERGKWEGANEKWMRELTDKASKCISGSQVTSARIAVSVIKGILYTCGLSSDSEWSQMKATKKPQTLSSQTRASEPSPLQAASCGTVEGGINIFRNASLAWDNTALQHESIATVGMPTGTGKAKGSMVPESFRESLPARPKSATVSRPHVCTVGPRGFTGGGGLGFNASSMSKFSVVRGASVGAAFNESTQRFNPFFNMSRHHCRVEKAVATPNPNASFTSVLSQTQISARSLSSVQAQAQAQSERQATANSRPPSSRLASVGKNEHVRAAVSEAKFRALPMMKVSLEARTNSARSTCEQSSHSNNVKVASPSLQRWIGQRVGVGDVKGRAEDAGATARTLAQFSRILPHGPILAATWAPPRIKDSNAIRRLVPQLDVSAAVAKRNKDMQKDAARA